MPSLIEAVWTLRLKWSEFNKGEIGVMGLTGAMEEVRRAHIETLMTANIPVAEISNSARSDIEYAAATLESKGIVSDVRKRIAARDLRKLLDARSSLPAEGPAEAPVAGTEKHEQ